MASDDICAVELEVAVVPEVLAEMQEAGPVDFELQGVSGGGGASNPYAVLYVSQSLTEEEQAQARENIGIDGTCYSMPCVMDYGAKGDGATDDTKTFQDALAENRVVFVPGGTYVLSGTLVIRENCCLELSQDTILKFTQTSGNCIEMRGSAVLRGNHGNIDVHSSFTGNVISVDTALDGVVHASIPPYEKSTPQWKRQRFIYDVNITRTEGQFQSSLTGGHSGTALYVSANFETSESYDGTNTAPITFIWAMTVSGLRIGGAFDYGINIQNKDKTTSGYGNDNDPAWNHDMRIEAVIVGCETGVRVFNCNNAHLDVSVQPNHSVNKVNGKYVCYAKNGIILEHSHNIDLSQSAVWDWKSECTLVDESERNTHIALIGDCRGTILSDFRLIEIPSLDIREDIYTDTPSNFDTMTILQEPANKWFKNRDGVPYFFNGTSEKQIALAEDVAIDSFFYTGKIAKFTNVMETAIDKNGNVYGTKNGYYDSQFNTLDDDGYHVHTGFIPCKKGDTFYTDGIKLRDDGCVRISLFDSSFNYVKHINGGNMMKTGYYVTYAETDNGFALTLNSADDAEINKFAYARFNFHNYDLGEQPVMTVNEEIKYVQAGFLSDDIKVKAENVVGLEGGDMAALLPLYINISAGDSYTCSTPIATFESALDAGRFVVAKITTDAGALFAQLCSYETSAENTYGRIVMFALGALTFTLTPTISGYYEVAVSGD